MSQHIPALTGVRGVAAVWVVLLHLSQSLRSTIGFNEAAPFIQSGFLGVDLFFILSGAVMYHVHAADFPQYRIKSHLAFLRLRFARVYPLHAFCLFAFALIIYLLPDFTAPYRPGTFSFSNFAATLLLVNNWGFMPTTLWNGPAWSLSAEWLGYLAFPFIVLGIKRFVPRGFELAYALALLFIFLIGMLAINAPDLGQMNKLGIIRMLFEFSAGCLFYKAAMGKVQSHKWTLPLSLTVILGCTYRIEYHWGAVFGLGLLVMSLCRQSRFSDILFGNAVAIWLGNISFSLYLSHWPLIQIYQWASQRTNIDKHFLAAMLVAAIIGVAPLLYHFVEVPSRRYLRGKMQNQHSSTLADTAIDIAAVR